MMGRVLQRAGKMLLLDDPRLRYKSKERAYILKSRQRKKKETARVKKKKKRVKKIRV